MSRTALDGYPLGDVEKEYFVTVVRKISQLYFVEVLGFCCMGNHFHILVRERPEDYRWNAIGYHIQSNNKDDFLSLDFWLHEFGVLGAKERLRRYRRFLYETGAMDKGKGAQLDADMVETERKTNFERPRARRFKYRTRYFTDSGIIGGKAFVLETYRKVKGAFQAKRDKAPRPISGLSGIYPLKRLNE
jgi:REP element-mobilizing transposase RayT